MKEQILKLRSEGKTYKEIQKELNCSKGTISYHCGNNQKEKTSNRQKKRRSNILLYKLQKFQYRKERQVIKFQKKTNEEKYDKSCVINYNYKDVLVKIGGTKTICYLSGQPIDIEKDVFHLDHIIPTSKGGNNSLENLGITLPMLNHVSFD